MRGRTSLTLLAATLSALGLVIGAYVVFLFIPKCLSGKPSLFEAVARFCAELPSTLN